MNAGYSTNQSNLLRVHRSKRLVDSNCTIFFFFFFTYTVAEEIKYRDKI